MAKLPKWLSQRADGVFMIDPDIAYPAVLGALGADSKKLDQYWVETAYQATKLKAQELIDGTELDPRPNMGLVLVIMSEGGRKDRWALANYPAGKGIAAATKGLEARQHFARIGRALD